MRVLIFSIALSFATAKCLAQPVINKVWVDENKRQLHLQGSFRGTIDRVTVQSSLQGLLFKNDSEVVTTIADSGNSSCGSIAIFTEYGADSVSLSCYRIVLTYMNNRAEGGAYENEEVDWSLYFRFAEIIHSKLQTPEFVQCSRRSTASYSIDLNDYWFLTIDPPLQKGSGILPWRDWDSSGKGFSAALSTPYGTSDEIRLIVGSVVGDSLLGAKTESDWHKIAPYNPSFQQNEIGLFFDSSRNMKQGSDIFWSKGPSQANGFYWRQDSAWFLPVIPRAVVYQSPVMSSGTFYRPREHRYELPSSPMDRKIDIYSTIGMKVGCVDVPAGASAAIFPSLPIGSYFIKMDNTIDRILTVQ